MALPRAIQALWNDLEAVRADFLREVAGLSQRQADWKPAEKEWSAGEVINHLTVARRATGTLTTKRTREREARARPAPYPSDFSTAPLPPWPRGPGGAPAVVWPEHGKPIGELLATMKATRERSRQSVEKLATLDPRA